MSTTDQYKQASFDGIAAELRNRIYEFMFAPSTSEVVPTDLLKQGEPPVLRVSKQIRGEAFELWRHHLSTTGVTINTNRQALDQDLRTLAFTRLGKVPFSAGARSIVINLSLDQAEMNDITNIPLADEDIPLTFDEGANDMLRVLRENPDDITVAELVFLKKDGVDLSRVVFGPEIKPLPGVTTHQAALHRHVVELNTALEQVLPMDPNELDDWVVGYHARLVCQLKPPGTLEPFT